MNALHDIVSIATMAAATARHAKPKQIEQKSMQDFVTDMDRGLQASIMAAIEKRFPGIPALGEEGMDEEATLPEKAFLIDPLDGTGNWIAGLPFSAVSIAYLEQGQSVMAVVASISGHDVFSAELGKGAWLNKERMGLRAPADLIGLSTGLLDSMVGDDAFRQLRRFGKLRNLGSQALHLCLVAKGGLTLNGSLEARLWDDAAGRLIAAESGMAYRAALPATDAMRPSARQRSLCAHPEAYEEAAAILEPFLGAGVKR